MSQKKFDFDRISELIQKGDIDSIKRIVTPKNVNKIRDNLGTSLMHVSAEFGRTEILRYLLSIGGDSNARDRYNHTPLHFAANNGHLGAVKVLLKFGA